MRGISRRRLARLTALFLGASALAGPSAFAADIAWNGTTASYDTAGNWSSSTVPGAGDNAIFPASPTVSALTHSGFSNLSVGSWTFNSGATGYNFTFDNGFGILHFEGDGIVDNYSNAPQISLNDGLVNLRFDNSASASDAVITENRGELGFHDSSTGATATLIGNSGASYIRFYDSSTAANATIDLSNTAQLGFFDTSTGGGATVVTDDNLDTFVDFSGSTGPAGDNKLSVGSISGGGSFYLGANALTVGSLNTSTTVSGLIADCLGDEGDCSGPGSLVKTGTGTLTLTGANTYTGGTVLSDGTITIGNNSALGTGDLSMAAGTTLSFDGDYTITNNITITGDPIFTPPSGHTDTIAGVISDGGGTPGVVEMNGAGTLVLTGTNTYTGGTTVVERHAFDFVGLQYRQRWHARARRTARRWTSPAPTPLPMI